MAKRRCIIHVGYPKTGTTSIQEFLITQTAALREKGVFVPVTGRAGEAAPGHHTLTEMWPGLDVRQPNSATAWQLKDELQDSDANVAILSSETWSDCTLRERRRMLFYASRSAGYQVEVLMYFRGLRAFLHSMYCEYVKHGGKEKFDDFLTTCLTDGMIVNNFISHSLDYLGFLNQVRAEVDVIVRPFSYEQASAAPGGIVDQFLGVAAELTSADVAPDAPSVEWRNPRFGPAHLESLRLINGLRKRLSAESIEQLEAHMIGPAIARDGALRFGAIDSPQFDLILDHYSQRLAELARVWRAYDRTADDASTEQQAASREAYLDAVDWATQRCRSFLIQMPRETMRGGSHWMPPAAHIVAEAAL